MCNVLRYTQVDARHASAGMKINGDVTSASTESLHIFSWKIYFSASFIRIQIDIAPPDGKILCFGVVIVSPAVSGGAGKRR